MIVLSENLLFTKKYAETHETCNFLNLSTREANLRRVRLTVMGAILKDCPDSGLPDSTLGPWMPRCMDHVTYVRIIYYYARFSIDSDQFGPIRTKLRISMS